MPAPCLILASSSPRRREILSALGLGFEIAPVDVDETPRADEDAASLVVRLAREKALAGDRPGCVVLAADTEVVLDGKVFGKPSGEAEALAMLMRLSGREHEVLTGVAVCTSGRVRTALSRTRVQFRELRRDEALDYWHSGEPRDKAGAYGIQGLGGVFVSRIDGSYSGVVGLPVYETALLLADAGMEITGIATERDV